MTKASLPLRDIIEKDMTLGENVTFIQAELTEITDTEQIIINLTGPLEDPEMNRERRIDYDYLVICTGATVTLNNTIEELNQIITQEKRAEYLSKYQHDIKYAESILIVGDDVTAVETLGEIIRQHNTAKRYAIMCEGDTLLPKLPPKAQKLAMDYFRDCGVTIFTNSKYQTKKELAADYDFVLQCTGGVCSVPFMNNHNFRSCKDKDNKILVNKFFQVRVISKFDSHTSLQTIYIIFIKLIRYVKYMSLK